MPTEREREKERDQGVAGKVYVLPGYVPHDLTLTTLCLLTASQLKCPHDPSSSKSPALTAQELGGHL